MKRSIYVGMLLLLSGTAAGYNGPGSGVSFVAALWSLIIGVFVVLSAILMWPLRVWLKRRKARAEAASGKPTAGE
ncbi:MAG: hypothetical protein IPK97_18885 [Ahniella sp.]|nr:hypothetical protein [Ahniella sp.]